MAGVIGALVLATPVLFSMLSRLDFPVIMVLTSSDLIVGGFKPSVKCAVRSPDR